MVIKDLDVYSKCVCVLFGRCVQNKSGSSNTAVEKTRETCQKKSSNICATPIFSGIIVWMNSISLESYLQPYPSMTQKSQTNRIASLASCGFSRPNINKHALVLLLLLLLLFSPGNLQTFTTAVTTSKQPPENSRFPGLQAAQWMTYKTKPSTNYHPMVPTTGKKHILDYRVCHTSPEVSP